MRHKYNYFYKITNNINGHFYYGIHSTDNINDGYMGSGHRLRKAYQLYGIENFSKEILKFFDNRDDLELYESEIVTEELVNDKECYNSIIGGLSCNHMDKVCVNYNGRNILVDRIDYFANKDKYKSMRTNKVCVIEGNEDKYKLIDVTEYVENKEKYKIVSGGRVSVKDKNGNFFSVLVDDERYKSGELVPIWKNRKHRKESIEKVKETYRKIGHQYGSKNSHYGTVWVTKENENKCIKKEELEKYKKDGWVKGRKLHFENDKITSLDKEVILNLRSEGLTWKEIAKKLSISLTVMQKWKKRNLNNN